MLRAVLPLMLLATQGCLVPIPSKVLHAYGVKGRVLDENGCPIPHAMILAETEQSAKQKRQAVTGPDGCFEIKPVKRWHGAVCLAPPSMIYLFPTFHPSFAPCEEISITAGGYPEQSFTLDPFEWRAPKGRCEGDYLIADKIMLFHQTTSNYLATVMRDFDNDQQGIASILLCEWNKNGWLRPICSTTDTNLIAIILDELAMPAEMAARPSAKTPDEDILCCMAFLDASSNVIRTGHIIHYDGTIKNSLLEPVVKTRTTLIPYSPDTTWRIRSTAISRLAYDVITKIRKRPEIHPWKLEEE